MSTKKPGADASEENGDAPELSPEVAALLSDAADKAEIAQATITQLTADLEAERARSAGLVTEGETLAADLALERNAHAATRDDLSNAGVEIDRLRDELTSARSAQRPIADLFGRNDDDDDDDGFDLAEGVYVLTTSKITDARDEQIPRGRLVTAADERAQALLAAEHARPATAEDLRAATHPPVAL